MDLWGFGGIYARSLPFKIRLGCRSQAIIGALSESWPCRCRGAVLIGASETTGRLPVADGVFDPLVGENEPLLRRVYPQYPRQFNRRAQ